MRKLGLVLILLSCFVASQSLLAQQPVKCGDIIEGEFTKPLELQEFVIQLNAGDQLSVSGSAFGDTLKLGIIVLSPIGMGVATNGPFYSIVGTDKAPEAQSGVLSAKGNYTIIVGNSRLTLDGTRVRNYDEPAGIGLFTLSIGCILRDGMVIESASFPQPTQSANTSSTGNNNNGNDASLPLVNPASGVDLPLVLGQPTVVAVTTQISYTITFQAQPGEKYQITITRQSGTAPLALTVYDPSKAAIFALAMGNSATFTTEIEIGTAGEHTLAFGLAALAGGAGNAAGVYQVTVTKLG